MSHPLARRVAHFVVRLSTVLAPRRLRDRWREEWLAEIDASTGAGMDTGMNDVPHTGARRPRGRRVLARSLGAPWDALLTRRRPPQLPADRTRGAWHGWRTDLTQALRLVTRTPGQTLMVVLCLGVGLTACMSAFSLVNALVWSERPGIHDRASLSQVYSRRHYQHYAPWLSTISARQYDLLRTPPAWAVTGIAVEGTADLAVRLGENVVSVTVAFVSGNYFEVLGTTAAMGRLVRSGDASDAADVVVIGDRFWRLHLGAASDAVGRVLTIADRSFRIVGVAPERFIGWTEPDIERGRSGIQIWLPLSHTRDWPGVPDPSAIWLTGIVRHAAGASREQAEAALRSFESALPALGPPQNTDVRQSLHLTPLGHPPQGSRAELFTALAAVLAAPLAVLLIGCANVANLRLARATERTRELAVRVSLGASRWQISRLLIVEIAIVTTLATLAGWAGTRVVLVQIAEMLPMPVTLDWRVVLFAAGLAGTIVALSGLAPAWLVTGRLMGAGLRQTPQAGGLAHSRLRNLLVAGQIAVSVILLVVGALLARSMAGMTKAIPDVSRHLVIATLNLTTAGHDAASASVFARDLISRLEREPRVRGAAIMSGTLLGGIAQLGWRGANDASESGEADRWRGTVVHRVSDGWFDAVDARIVAGRRFTASDGPAAVVVVNEALARAMAPGRSVVGETLLLRASSTFIASQRHAPVPSPSAALSGGGPGADRELSTLAVEIIGVVADPIVHPRSASRRRDTDAIVEEYVESKVYLPLTGDVPLSFTLLVRGDDAVRMTGDVQRIIAAADPRAPWTQIETARAMFVREIGGILHVAIAVAGLGVVALGLAMAGLYAVMAYVVSLRRREIGIRLAVGARADQVVALMVRHALRVVGAGAAAGLALALLTAWLMRAAFVGVPTTDPLTILPTVGLLAAVAVIASVIPALRAARIDPIIAIRDE